MRDRGAIRLTGQVKKLPLIWFLAFGTATTVSAASLPLSAGPVVDPAGLLSPASREEIRAAAAAFRDASGRWLVMVVVPRGTGLDPAAVEKIAREPWQDEGKAAAIGIIFATAPDNPTGMLLVVDPAWRAVARDAWITLFPQRLAQKYGEEPFEARVVHSARYLAAVFPEKIAFLSRPPDRIGEESVEFAENVMTVVKWFVYFIILFTFFRTIFPARLRPEDKDEFSNELRRLSKERRIW